MQDARPFLLVALLAISGVAHSATMADVDKNKGNGPALLAIANDTNTELPLRYMALAYLPHADVPGLVDSDLFKRSAPARSNIPLLGRIPGQVAVEPV